MADATVDPGLERFGQTQYQDLKPRISAMKDEALGVVVLPGSLLSREDGRTSFSPISYQVRWQLQLASEHLVAFTRLVDGHGLPNYAGYVLIRAAIESAACALWLLQPQKSDRRVLRALQMSWWNQTDAALFSTAAGFDPSARDAEIKSELTELRMAVKSLRQTSLDKTRISHTEMLTTVQRTSSIANPTPLVAWRQCSALAHGNSAVAEMSMQHEAIHAEEPRIHVSRASWALVSALLRTAVNLAQESNELFRNRAQPA